MDENAQSFSPSDNSQSESPKIHLPKLGSSGLTLVIPSLRSLKALQSTTKQPKQLEPAENLSSSIYPDVDAQERKAARPVKLKPLKEVLTKLIVQIKKKDDYAFFLRPVDAANVPGYSDLIKCPMDFGTMTNKVRRGKYRSLDEFASDFKLVLANAKIFNPPGSIYYTEADKIEIWGLDHINKAASTVIQYETDWTIDVEKEEEEQSVNVDQDEDDSRGTPMDIDGSILRERSLSVAPSQPQGSTRRGVRGPYRRERNAPSNALSETLELDGGLPGSKDGIGAFPPESDWARTMLALKLKGKRYKTKKERMRIEREGPPLLSDGSLDYTEMEDPFSVLSFFVADPPSKPQLIPLYPPLYQPTFPQPEPHSSQLTPQPQPPIFPGSSQPLASTSSATTVPPDHSPLPLPFLDQPQLTGNAPKPYPTRRHWVINRNTTSRQKGKEKEDEQQELSDPPAWQTPREPHTVDFGTFSTLGGALAEEMRKRGLSSSAVNAVMEVKEDLDEEVNLHLIRNSLDLAPKIRDLEEEEGKIASMQKMDATNLLTNGYWTTRRVVEAEEYLRDIVYGGVDGFAYVRSLAEFVDGYDENPSTSLSMFDQSSRPSGIGTSLQQWVIDRVADPLTEGRHSLLRETAVELVRQQHHESGLIVDPRRGTVASQVAASLHLNPSKLIALSSLLHIRLHKIDMGSLLKTPQELFVSEEEWAGKGLREKKRLLGSKRVEEVSAIPISATTFNGPVDMEVEEPEKTWMGVDMDLSKRTTNGNGWLSEYDPEGPEELNEVLEWVADVIVDLDRKIRTKGGSSGVGKGALNGSATGGSNTDEADKQESVEAAREENTQSMPDEEPALRNLRLNLLALAKRAPLDIIARLPKDLVPAHIRHFVPTVGLSS